MKWEDVNKVIKWTLQNAKHLDVSDIYLIEKATDDCHLSLAQDAVLTTDAADDEQRCLCVGNYKNGCKIHGGEWRLEPPLF